MDFAVVASGAIPAEGSNVTTRSLVVPTVADDDVLIIAACLAGGSTTITASGLAGIGDPTALTQRSGLGVHSWVYKLTAAQSATVVTLTTSSSLKVATVWAVLRGVTGLASTATSVNGTSTPNMTPPAFTPAAGVGLVQVAGMATGAGAPPTTWTPPSPLALEQTSGTGGTTGRAGVALAVLTADQTSISGSWTANVNNSWGVIALPLAIVAADEGETHTGGSTTGVTVAATTGAGFPWVDQDAADTLLSPTPTTSTAGGGPQTPGSTLIGPDDSRFRYRGAGGFAFGTAFPDTLCYQPSSRYPYGWGNPATWAVEFDLTGAEFEVRYKYLSATGAGWFRISANGQRVTDVPVKPGPGTGGSMTSHRVTFGSSGTRRILLEFQGVPFGGVYLPAGATIAHPGAFSRRAIFEGDSITAGSNENSGTGAGTWFARFARYAGIDDPWNVAIGGTGMTEPGTATTIPGRISQVTSVPNVDDIFLWCGGNDGSTAIVSQATTYIANVKAAHPQARIYVIGTWSPAVTAPSTRAARSIDLQAAALANGVPFISPITGEVRDGQGQLVASQGPWISTSGQVAAYVGSDNVHPTDAGHAYIAKRMAQAVAALPGTSGAKVSAAGSSVGVGVATSGTGRKAGGGSSAAAVGVAAVGAGRRVVSGGSSVTIGTTPSGVGVKVGAGGSTVAAAVTAVGSGQRVELGQGGSVAGVDVEPSGSGRKVTRGGSVVDLTIGTVGQGRRVEAGSGGSVATVLVGTSGAGTTLRTGGSVATLGVTAVGTGRNPGASRDITITLGPPVGHPLTLEHPTGRPFAIGTPRR